MIYNIITIFPEIFNSYINESMLKRAQEKKIIKIKFHDLRKWTSDKHKTIDDTPYGGGAGMLMKVKPIYKALHTLKKSFDLAQDRQKTENPSTWLRTGRKQKIILLSAKGKPWTQKKAKKYSKLDNIILICGRYEGVDERVKKFIDEEISIGDYVLTGGELPAMIIIDSITRLLPGVLGNKKSAIDESHTMPGTLEYPHYTRPEVFEIREGGKKKKFKVPKILLSGNHKKIEEWRELKKKIR